MYRSFTINHPKGGVSIEEDYIYRLYRTLYPLESNAMRDLGVATERINQHPIGDVPVANARARIVRLRVLPLAIVALRRDRRRRTTWLDRVDDRVDVDFRFGSLHVDLPLILYGEFDSVGHVLADQQHSQSTSI